MLEYLRDDFNGLLIGKVILVEVIGAGVRVMREHCLYCEDSGGRIDKNLSLIEGSGANGEGGDNNEVRICKGGVVVDPDGSSRVATNAYGILCQRQAYSGGGSRYMYCTRPILMHGLILRAEQDPWFPSTRTGRDQQCRVMTERVNISLPRPSLSLVSKFSLLGPFHL